MTLDKYLSKHKISNKEFCAKFNPPVSESAVSYWRTGLKSPNRINMKQIIKITKSAVDIVTFF